jgi:hypothetical protein
MERIVPPEGATICGEFIKGGTLVGMNSWVVHRNRDLYGQDCDEWNPNRWLCESDKRRKMENALLTVSPNFRHKRSIFVGHCSCCCCLQKSMLIIAL